MAKVSWSWNGSISNTENKCRRDHTECFAYLRDKAAEKVRYVRATWIFRSCSSTTAPAHTFRKWTCERDMYSDFSGKPEEKEIRDQSSGEN